MATKVWYADTSALAKLITGEPEGPPLRRWVRRHPVATSILTTIELARVASGMPGGAGPSSADRVLRALSVVKLSDGVIATARSALPVHLRTLDAIHLASALSLERSLAGIVAYDQQLLEAAEGYGIRTASPS